MRKLMMASAILALCACKSNEIGNSKDVSPDSIYQEYMISASEDEETAEATAMFRFGGEKGTTLVLDDKSNVRFDGKLLKADSSFTMGAYYRAQLKMPATGEHYWTFTDNNGKAYTNKVRIQSFRLLNQFNKPLAGADLVLQFEGLPDNEEVQIYVTDTASGGKYKDVNITLITHTNAVTIPAAQIKMLAPGPLKIDIKQQKDLPLAENTKEGGSIYYLYKLSTKKVRLKG